MAWLSITVEVEATQAEALSEALIEAGAHSVDLEPRATRTRLTAIAGRDSDAGRIVACAAQRAGIPSPEFQAGRIEDDDWVRRSQAQFGPLRAGERLWIVPSWHTPPDPQAVVVRLDPGLAFGTGGHPSTHMVLARLEALVRGGERVLDFGCGSGILAIAAAKLGAGWLDAVDLDPQALEVARANALLNGVTLRAALPGELPPGSYDLVLVNILAGPIIELAPEITARTRSGGRVLLSGILAEQAAGVTQAYAAGFDTAIRARENDWVLIEGQRR